VASEALVSLRFRGVYAWIRCAFAVFLLGYANAAPSRCACLVTLRFRRGVCVWLRCAFVVVGCAVFSRCICWGTLRFRRVFWPYGYDATCLCLMAYLLPRFFWRCIKEPAVMRATPRAWCSSVRTVTRIATPVCIELIIRARQTPPSCSAGIAHSLRF